MGYSFGKFTCFTPNGCSSVDYVVASENLLGQIPYFKVSPFIPNLSDAHCKLSWTLISKFQRTSRTHSYNTVPSQYFWDDQSSIKLQTELQSPDSLNKLNMFNSQDIDIEDENSLNEAAYMPTLERLKAVGGLGFASPLPPPHQKIVFQKDAKWCILLHFGYQICSVKSLNILNIV
jgi:hypothetical protein